MEHQQGFEDDLVGDESDNRERRDRGSSKRRHASDVIGNRTYRVVGLTQTSSECSANVHHGPVRGVGSIDQGFQVLFPVLDAVSACIKD